MKIIDKGNLKLIDIVKLVMAILVVSLHTLPFYGAEGTIAHSIWWVFSQEAVPFFFLSTGYFISREYRRIEGENLTAIIKKYLFRYIRIYLIWNVVYLPLAIAFYINNDMTVIESVKSYVWDFFLSGQHYNSWILWYILSSIYTFIALLMISFYKGEKRWLLFVLSLGALVAYVGVHVIKGGDDIHSFFRLLNGCIYMPLGMLIYDYQQNREIHQIPYILEFAAAAVVTVVLQQQGGVLRIVYEVTTWFVVTSMFICVISSKLQIDIDTTGYRKVSSYIYYLHLWIWTVYYMLVYGKKHYGMDAFVVTLLMAIIASTVRYGVAVKNLKISR